MKVRCNKCGYIGNEEEFSKSTDFFQKSFIRKCAKPKCDNFQTPGDASMRMMPGVKPPFEYIRPASKDKDSLAKTLHKAKEAS